MDIKNKALIGLVISMGLYSAANAVQYVSSLSAQDAESLLSVIKDTKTPVAMCSSIVIGVQVHKNIPA